MSGSPRLIHRDVVVVGTGVAGLTAALGLAPRSVALVSKTPFGAGGSSSWAQGGVAAAVGPDDSPAAHAADTLAVSGGLGDAEIVALLTAQGAERIARLIALGVAFDRNERGGLALGREAAHGRRRILHAHGDATGAELVRALTAAVTLAPEVSVFAGTEVLDLAVADGRVVGVHAVDGDGESVLFLGRAVVLATGGCGQLYRHTTNPPESAGDGLAMAARAGARLIDLEFVQFHPTALAVDADPLPLLTEALRGEGAVLLDGAGKRFMPAEHPLAELAPRDEVARAIARRVLAGERVVLDAREAVGERFPQRFPTVFEACRRYGLDPRTDLLPVTPASHYHMGGIEVDSWGRSSLAGLFACGEVACTGAHGANRLASNSLLEALVFGSRVAEELARSLASAVPAPRPRPAAAQPTNDALSAAVIERVRALMEEKVGVIRDGGGLAAAREELAALWAGRDELGPRARNLLTAARLVTAAAAWRRESRGSHFREDFPHEAAGAPLRWAWRLGADGEPAVCEAVGVAAAVVEERA